jgi:predicted CXXCH cytochrome family protein
MQYKRVIEPQRREGDFRLQSDFEFTAVTDGTCCRRLLAPALRRNLHLVVSCLSLAALVLSASLLCSGETSKNKKKHHPAQPAPPAVTHPTVVKVSDSRVAPLPPGKDVVSYHAPYDAGDCSICHTSNDAQNPGPVKGAVNEICLGCHDDFRQTLAMKSVHPAAQDSCVNCHNPHNSKQPKLLLEDTGTLCFGCHQDIQEIALQSPVKHDALTQGGKCVNCHNPHGANVEHLLVQLPMQLCLQCHGNDNVVDHNGKKLVNMTRLLAENPHQHGPVASQDCSACHMPHGSKNFRLLTNPYPATFYSGYDPQNYALCFGCHDEKAFTQPQTEELTQFRDGSKNLHYVHVNRSIMGRTCRACHDVHASPQEHQIRDAVPYGSRGWMLKLNYTKTATGGSCSKTCHQTRSYNNTLTKASSTAAAPAASATGGEAKTSATAPEPAHDAKP